jgi:hypothetical protein
MTNPKHFTSTIFPQDEARFHEVALEMFRYQSEHNVLYRNYLRLLKIAPEEIKKIEEIPFLPIQFFKSHKVVTGEFDDEIVFTSSSTSGTGESKHHVRSVQVYEDSFLKGFEYFYGTPKEWTVFALLPSYLERTGSSLVYMAQKLIGLSNDPRSGFFLYDHQSLLKAIHEACSEKRKVLLLGVTYALLDLEGPLPSGVTVMETGGMKGKRAELTREQVHEELRVHLGTEKVHSEYGMTELLSQAYSKGDGLFECPPWMRVLIREVNDPLSLARFGKTGGVNVIDLANVHSCAFIATQDLGKMHPGGLFEIQGRFDNAEIRGCNLMVV